MKPFLPAAALAALLAPQALAADAPPPAAAPPAACDFFQTQLISVFCARSVDVGLNGGASRSRTQSGFPFGGFIDIRNSSLTAAASLAVTPFNWLRLSASPNYVDTTSLVRSSPFTGTTFVTKSSTSHAGFQTFNAGVSLLDTGPGDTRYVVVALAGGGFQPAYTGVKSDTLILGQLTGAAKWRLGQSDYSLNFRATAQGQRITNNKESLFAPGARLLLAHERFGLALGPTFTSNHLATFKGGLPAHSNIYYAGLTALWQPFRMSNVPVLSAFTLQGSAAQSLGNAVFTNYDRSRGQTYSANAALHFEY